MLHDTAFHRTFAPARGTLKDLMIAALVSAGLWSLLITGAVALLT